MQEVPAAKKQRMDLGGGANPKSSGQEELKRLVGGGWPLNTLNLPSFHAVVTQLNSHFEKNV